MNAVIYDAQGVRRALRSLNKHIHQTFGPPEPDIKWVFPNGGGPDKLPTWSLPIERRKYLILGFMPEFRWWLNDRRMRRCPLLLSLGEEKAQDGMTPIVEVNIPDPMRRTVSGCFASDASGKLWLYHRGSRLTVHSNQKIPKAHIHAHFKNKLIPAEDNGPINELIPVIRVESSKNKFTASMTDFVNSIKDLKDTWPSGTALRTAR